MIPLTCALNPHILFLDFDGVLHPTDAGDPPEEGRPARARHFMWAFELVRLLAPAQDIQIVVHSSWRTLLTERSIKALLPDHLARRVLGPTPAGFAREASIVEWIRLFKPRSFVILDDEPAEFAALTPSLIVCDPFTGISDPQVQFELSRWVASC